MIYTKYISVVLDMGVSSRKKERKHSMDFFEIKLDESFVAKEKKDFKGLGKEINRPERPKQN